MQRACPTDKQRGRGNARRGGGAHKSGGKRGTRGTRYPYNLRI